MPDVQKPHCRPWHSMNPSCTGSSWPFCSRPSTVRTERPSAMAASTVHDLTGRASSHTTQLPQFDVSQPQWLLCGQAEFIAQEVDKQQPRLHLARVFGAVHQCAYIPHRHDGRPARAAAPAQRAGGELGDQVPLVVLGSALVGDRVAVLGGDRPGRGEALLVGRAAEEGTPRPRRPRNARRRPRSGPGRPTRQPAVPAPRPGPR